MFVVKSGRPAGEIYNWFVRLTTNVSDAELCAAAMQRMVDKTLTTASFDWAHGPFYREISEGEIPLEWTGYELVEAELWNGEEF